MKFYPPSFSKAPVKFRMPTADNLVPIRLDMELDGQRLKDAFTWNINDPDSEVINFSRRTVKDLKLPPAFMTQITQSIQLAEFRSYQGQDMQAKEMIVPLKLDVRVNNTVIRDQFLWDISNFEKDPEEFAKSLCEDLNIEDPEVAPAVAVSIREQLYELAVQNVSSAKEYRIGKKGRRGVESVSSSKAGNGAIDLARLFGNKGSVIRKRKEWHLYEPIVDVLSKEEAEALDAREERNARMKKKLEDKEDSFQTH
ncbi:chromatin structure-remodeling complex protein BSH isoform X2 [Asparagus officinalis]|uniref:chromatin structure-remodeling complex protein BSH isoform X2 n=1 Tax=Asparagus officinalis TaxID=4686 RepID=UPI00098DF000|nr:chromatin structure-remodeling complex protein BSH isoform X2 [Asparagus officinalis]